MDLPGEPMSLNQNEIRTLRQRLGWSLAEMARQMGCTTDLIQAWEKGDCRPDPDGLNQLRYLRDHVESKSHTLSQVPLAEREMESRNVAQLTHRDLLDDFQ